VIGVKKEKMISTPSNYGVNIITKISAKNVTIKNN